MKPTKATMTPKEKAQALYDKFSLHTTHLLDPEVEKVKWNAKQCALIAVKEIIDTLNDVEAIDQPVHDGKTWITANQYWQSVKKEIENL